MNSVRVYNQIVNRARERVRPEGYFERHHVIPKSFGGDDSSENLVNLTAREHFLAHWLLHRIYATRGTAMAWLRMTTVGPYSQGRKVNSRLFERARRAAGVHGSGTSNPRSKFVVNLDDGKFFPSARAASLFYGIRENGVASQIKTGNRVNGYRIVYACDPDIKFSEAFGVRKKKPVRRLSDGARFDSALDAAIAVKLNKNAISTAIARGTRSAGSYWEYVT